MRRQRSFDATLASAEPAVTIAGPRGFLDRPDIVVGVLIVVTNHAAERYRQRVRGSLEEKLEVAAAVARGREAGLVERGAGGTLLIRDPERRELVYVCRPEADELVVVTLWEDGEKAAVPRRFTDALRRDDHRR